MRYDGLFLHRIDYQDKEKRSAEKNLEMIWSTSDSLEANANIFTGILYNDFYAPKGLYIDILSNEEPVIDDVESAEYNVDKKVCLKLLKYLHCH